MISKKVLQNILSNWTGFFINIAIAFIVSPIFVSELGNEVYGIWVLIVSITGFFNVLDFGINTAVVRYISKYLASKKYDQITAVISSALFVFLGLSLIGFIIILYFGWNFKELFDIPAFSQKYLFYVFLLVGLDLAINICFGVFQGALQGLQKFIHINFILISVNILKNIMLVYLLIEGYSLLALALVQLLFTIVRYVLYILILLKDCPVKTFTFKAISKPTLKKLFNYSIYSLIIAIAGKVIFYSDSVVIAANLTTADVTLFAIPSMITIYLEQFVWAMIAVLVPVISGMDAKGEQGENKQIYLYGTLYVQLICMPVFFVLALFGRDFLGLWMGDDFTTVSGDILLVLLSGFYFLLSQLISQGILKGISKHAFVAYVLIAEAVANLAISLILVQYYGVLGVAIGTVLPTLVVNVFLLPGYTCRVLGLKYFPYLLKSTIYPAVFLGITILFGWQLSLSVDNYSQLFFVSLSSLVLFYTISFFLFVNKLHRSQVFDYVKRVLAS
jgi:O-antigen/teichoic acid export membrane protein